MVDSSERSHSGTRPIPSLLSAMLRATCRTPGSRNTVGKKGEGERGPMWLVWRSKSNTKPGSPRTDAHRLPPGWRVKATSEPAQGANQGNSQAASAKSRMEVVSCQPSVIS